MFIVLKAEKTNSGCRIVFQHTETGEITSFEMDNAYIAYLCKGQCQKETKAIPLERLVDAVQSGRSYYVEGGMIGKCSSDWKPEKPNNDEESK